MEKATRLKQQLERLLAQDLSEMGHQARILHRERVEELRTLCTPVSAENPTGTPSGPAKPPGDASSDS